MQLSRTAVLEVSLVEIVHMVLSGRREKRKPQVGNEPCKVDR